MTTHPKNALQRTWEAVLSTAVDEMSRMTSDKQARLTRASVVESPEAVPEAFRDAFLPLAERTAAFPYVVLTPSYRRFKENSLESLLFCIDGCLYVLQHSGSEVTCTDYPLDAINYAELRTILLAAWLTISGISRSGALTSSTVRFNTVTLVLVEPLIRKIRPAADRPAGDLAAERAKFDVLARPHFKFMSAAKKSLRPGDRVLQYVLQPEIRTNPLLPFLGQHVPTHMIILTDLDLILIRNPDEWWWNRRAPYGSIVHYVPLKRITRLSLAEGEDGLLDLCVHLPGEEEIRRQFQTSQRADVERLVSQFETLTPADGELAAAPA